MIANAAATDLYQDLYQEHYGPWGNRLPKRRPEQDSAPYRVYVLSLVPPGTYYVGYTNNLGKRYRQHLAGVGAAITKRLGVRGLLASVPCETQYSAMRLERDITLTLLRDGCDTYGAEATIYDWSFSKRIRVLGQQQRKHGAHKARPWLHPHLHLHVQRHLTAVAESLASDDLDISTADSANLAVKVAQVERA